MKLAYPLHYIWISQKYKPATHRAIDLGWSSRYGGKNAPVYASGDGVVTSIRDGRNNSMTPGDSGNYVTVRYGDYETRACHLLKGSITVRKGDKVTRETVIGQMGNSGYCGAKKGNHVHYILWYDGVRVDPTHYLYAYPDEVVDPDTEKDFHILHTTTPEPVPVPKEPKIEVTAKSGVWARSGIGFSHKKTVAIPYGTRCTLLERDAGSANGYKWDKIEYEGKVLYMPNKWNKYLTD